MRRALRTGLLLAVALSGLTQAGVVANHGALQLAGNKIVDAAGAPIQVTDLQGRTSFHQVLSGQRELVIAHQAGVSVVQVITPAGRFSATIAPSR